MEKLIEALQIFLKYRNETYPTHCEHDILMISRITEDEVSQDDKKRLNDLEFNWNSEYECWTSYRYGSA
jgi:hypothetical protein